MQGHSGRGFTLVELMMVVAILSVLAAIAVPEYHAMQFKVKRSEAFPVVEAIRAAEASYEAVYDSYLAAATLAPDANPGRLQRPWNYPPEFVTLGFLPDGEIRGSYRVTLSGPDFTAEGHMDTDGNDVDALFAGTRSSETTMITAASIY